MLVSMKDLLINAQNGAYAVPHFNVWNVEMIEGVMDAAEEMRSPVIISFGSGFLQNTDVNHYASIMTSMARQATIPAVVHWDHGRSFEIVKHAHSLGFNSVMIDASANPLETNIRMTKEVVDWFHPLGIPVEAELGHVGAETNYEEALANYGYTNPDEAKEFVTRTGIDALAIAIGNQHGVYSSKPKINFEILEKVRSFVDIPLVLHGASGICDADITKAISAGIVKINIHTELCEAAMSAIQDNLVRNKAYLGLQQDVRKSVCTRAKEKIILFRSAHKAE